MAGCATLKPLHLEETSAMPPASAPLWEALGEVRSDDWLALLNTHSEALEWRLRSIDSATSSIDMQTFLWDDDEVGLTILLHLIEAADRGVRVRLLIDDTFTISHAAEIWSINHHPNIEYRVYNPFLRRSDGLLLRQLMNLGEFSRLNHRMHNKALIVDNRVAIVGGRNLADEYFGAHEHANFRDLEVLSSGAHIEDLSRLFDTFWNNPWTFPEDRLQKKPIGTMSPEAFADWLSASAVRALQENESERRNFWMGLAAQATTGSMEVIADKPAPMDPAVAEELPNQLAAELVSLLGEAREEIILVSAYLIPTPEFEAAVEQAEDRGVSVTILTNSLQSNNHIAAHSAYRHHINRLLSHGAEIHEVNASAKDRNRYMRFPIDEKQLGLHAKFTLIDDEISVVGSANLDPRSLRLNTEMGLIVRSAEFNQLIRGQIELDFDGRNSWQLKLMEDGAVHWLSDDQVLTKQPVNSSFQRLEDWFLSLLPVEDQL